MHLAKKVSSDIQEGDFTPMIDMVFQLIAFFMVLLNFAEGEQLEAIQLPESVLARPPEGRIEFPITLHVTRVGTVYIGGDEIPPEALSLYLKRESAALEMAKKKAADASVIIRGDRRALTGKVQQVIQICQVNGFEKFMLRAKEQAGH